MHVWRISCHHDRGLTYIRRNVLHWLDVTDRVRFRVCAQVFKCLHGMAPDYLSTICHPVSRLPGRPNLRSANCGQLDVPRVTLSSCGVRAFAHANPSPWNTLPVHVKTITTFMRYLKALSLFSVLISYLTRLGCDHINALYKFTITYLPALTLVMARYTENTEQIFDILKYRLRYRRRYFEYRKIPNTDN